MREKISLSLSIALLGMALAFGTVAHAQVSINSLTRSTRAGDSMTVFWEKFKTAVIKGDKATVVALSRFPISRGYGMSSLRNKAQFLRHYREVFFNETNAAECFPKAKPMVDPERPKEFSISCCFRSGCEGGAPFQYTFTLTRNGWRFTAFENINE